MKRDTLAIDTTSLSDPIPVAVIISSYNRAPVLIMCLEHLERQNFPDFEVIVVDDGSTDDTAARMEQYLKATPLCIRYVRQQNAGPAKARNRAIAMAQAPICLMIGDDILASADFVSAHLRFHREHPGEACAALGLTRWNETHQTVTPFMRWLDEGGVQFAYWDLLAGTEPDWRHFYTSNLSLKTSLLRQNPFDEAFSRERWVMEDLELGYRLERTRGLRLSFLPEALAEHLHPTTFRQTCRRFFEAGLSSKLFDDLWPERQPAPRGPLRRKFSAFVRWNAWILRTLTWITELVTQACCPNPLLRPVLGLHASMGYNRSDTSTPTDGLGRAPASPDHSENRSALL